MLGEGLRMRCCRASPSSGPPRPTEPLEPGRGHGGARGLARRREAMTGIFP